MEGSGSSPASEDTLTMSPARRARGGRSVVPLPDSGCRQHRMLAARREKTHQAARNRLNVPMAAGLIEHPQLAAGGWRPALVQVQHQRPLALLAPERLINMACISRARRIPRIVQLELE